MQSDITFNSTTQATSSLLLRQLAVTDGGCL